MRVADHTHKAGYTVIIKKYANRRLYDTKTSSYVTLDHLCEMVKQGTAFEVRDARTNDDITRSVLLQIIFEEEAKGQNLLSIRFLRHLIRFYGDSMQVFVPGYLDLAIDNLARNRESMRDHLTEALGGNYEALETENRNSRALFEKAVEMMPPPEAKAGGAPSAKPMVVREQSARSAEEIGQLKTEIEEMRRLFAELKAQSGTTATAGLPSPDKASD
jgi:polyhydroxyalkanoate synthesis repressor PhaR